MAIFVFFNAVFSKSYELLCLFVNKLRHLEEYRLANFSETELGKVFSSYHANRTLKSPFTLIWFYGRSTTYRTYNILDLSRSRSKNNVIDLVLTIRHENRGVNTPKIAELILRK